MNNENAYQQLALKTRSNFNDGSLNNGDFFKNQRKSYGHNLRSSNMVCLENFNTIILKIKFSQNKHLWFCLINTLILESH